MSASQPHRPPALIGPTPEPVLVKHGRAVRTRGSGTPAGEDVLRPTVKDVNSTCLPGVGLIAPGPHPRDFECPTPQKGLHWVTVIPGSSALLLTAGVCAVVTGFGAGGTATPVNTSALAPQVPLEAAAPLPTPTAAPTKCTASPRNATPSRSSNATIIVRTTRGANADLMVRYPTTTRSFTIVADSAGMAVITFPISRSVPGSPVRVDVSTNSGQICSTQFTPQ